MAINSAAKWQQYKTNFLRANRCTDDEFEQAYIAFMESKPNDKAYRQFARKYGMKIFHDPYIPERVQVVLSVNIQAMKVMAKSHLEAEAAIEEILTSAEPRH